MDGFYKKESRKCPLVSIIIVHRNGEKILTNCLTSLYRSEYKNYEIILVDNNSTDRSVEIVRKKFPDVKIVENRKNYGFAEGNNIGTDYTKGKYVVFLNNDTEVDAKWLIHLLECAESEESIGIVQPKIKSLDDKSKFEYAGASGGYIDRFGFPFCRGRIFGYIEEDFGQYDDKVEISWGCGCALLIRKSLIDNIGLFDKDFFAHQEEIDFCWRAWLHGYKAVVCPASVVYHLGGSTLGMKDPYKMYLNHRNNLLILLKNLRSWELCFIFPLRILLDLSTILYSPKRFFQVMKAISYLGSHIESLVKKRKVVQHIRKRKSSIPIYKKSIVFDYFIKKKKTFAEIDSSKILLG